MFETWWKRLKAKFIKERGWGLSENAYRDSPADTNKNDTIECCKMLIRFKGTISCFFSNFSQKKRHSWLQEHFIIILRFTKSTNYNGANRAPWTWKKCIKMNDERFKNSIKAIVKTLLAESLNTWKTREKKTNKTTRTHR